VNELAERPAPKRSRSVVVFYAVLGVVVAGALLGVWLWRAYAVWWFDADEAKRRQAEAAARLGVPVEKAVDIGDGIKLELVLVPAGRFRMGHQVGVEDAEYFHQFVRITKPFYMGKHEVTQEQWEKVMGTNPSHFKGPKRPAENVSWDNCQEFLEKLNRLSPHPRPLPAAGEGAERMGGFRLPTEAEWEWACRAGTRTRFCSGDANESTEDFAWFSASETHPAGEKRPNAWGLYDMHGNVSELCGDWCDPYSGGWMPKTDPTGPTKGVGRVVRGGCWMLNAGEGTSAVQRFHGGDHSGGILGFRVVLPTSRAP
jgi:formylglycine-generating enzyme required for sulfatase activity